MNKYILLFLTVLAVSACSDEPNESIYMACMKKQETTAEYCRKEEIELLANRSKIMQDGLSAITVSCDKLESYSQMSTGDMRERCRKDLIAKLLK